MCPTTAFSARVSAAAHVEATQARRSTECASTAPGPFTGANRAQRPAFVHKLIHQGTRSFRRLHPFAAVNPWAAITTSQCQCVCASRALAFGKTPEEVKRRHAGMAGAAAPRLDEPAVEHFPARTADLAALGKLVAPYEHSVSPRARLADRFDQWAELGRCSQRHHSELGKWPRQARAHSSTNADSSPLPRALRSTLTLTSFAAPKTGAEMPRGYDRPVYLLPFDIADVRDEDVRPERAAHARADLGDRGGQGVICEASAGARAGAEKAGILSITIGGQSCATPRRASPPRARRKAARRN